MPTMAPEQADEIITGWLAGIDLQGWDNPADITATGGGGTEASGGMTGCGMCTGSYCNGLIIHCF
jgi:hypothetical protein